MNNFMDFTLNPETYPEEKLRPYVDRLQRNHQKFIMILDPSKIIYTQIYKKRNVQLELVEQL